MRRETLFAMNIALALVFIGLVMSYSAGIGRPQPGGQLSDPVNYLKAHAVYAGIGLILMLLAARIDYRIWQARPVFWLLAGSALVALVLVLIVGDEVRGAQRWLNVGGFSFQPSEVAKLVLVIALAVKLAENQEHIRTFSRGFIPPIIITGLLAGLVLLEQDLGTPVVLGTVAIAMIFMAGGKLWHIALVSAPAAAGVVAAIRMSPERMERITTFLHPWDYRSDGALQLIESMTGFVRGGLWGMGLGAGEQKLYWLPDAHSDFIFSVWGEEMGLAGTLALVVLFGLFVVAALRIAVCARDLFGTLLASGVATLITVQAAANMGVTTGLLPTKGLGLPFVSAGGSSLVINMVLVGILLSVGSRAVERDIPAPIAAAARRA
jgi:cell division protein FtsW